MQRSHRAVLLVSALIAWAAFASSAQAAGWEKGPAFGSGEVTALSGTATNPAGVSTVVWVQADPDPMKNDPVVYMRRHAADGTLGPELKIGPGNSAVVEATAADTVVAWTGPSGGDDGETRVSVTWVSASGDRFTSTAGTVNGSLRGSLLLAVEPDGTTFVAWSDDDEAGPDEAPRLHIRRLAPGRPVGPPIDLGPVNPEADIRSGDLALAPGGGVFLSWRKPDQDGAMADAWVARFDADGQIDGKIAVSEFVAASQTQLVSGTGGAIMMWREGEIGGTARLMASRLPSTGPVAGPARTITSGISPDMPMTAAAVAPDGTATIAYGKSTEVSATTYVRRLGTDGMPGPERVLSEAPGFSPVFGFFPMLTPGPGGSTIAAWVGAYPEAMTVGKLFTRTIAADGTLAPQIVEVPGTEHIRAESATLASNGAGDAMLAWLRHNPDPGPGERARSIRTATLDAMPPAVTANIPATLERGVEASMSVTATDTSGIAGITWQFGDGSGASGAEVSHAYARAGTFQVEVTVTDSNDNETVASRTVAVSDPVGRARVSARLKLTRVVRKRGSVKVAGTLDRRASGRVTVAWKQKVGRRTVRRVKRANIKNGRFSTTVKLTRRLARTRTNGTLTVTYGGNADTRAARITRTRVKAR